MGCIKDWLENRYTSVGHEFGFVNEGLGLNTLKKKWFEVGIIRARLWVTRWGKGEGAEKICSTTPASWTDWEICCLSISWHSRRVFWFGAKWNRLGGSRYKFGFCSVFFLLSCPFRFYHACLTDWRYFLSRYSSAVLKERLAKTTT